MSSRRRRNSEPPRPVQIIREAETNFDTSPMQPDETGAYPIALNYDNIGVMQGEITYRVKFKGAKKGKKKKKLLLCCSIHGIRLLDIETCDELGRWGFDAITRFVYNTTFKSFQFSWRINSLEQETFFFDTSEGKQIQDTITEFLKEILDNSKQLEENLDEVFDKLRVLEKPNTKEISKGGVVRKIGDKNEREVEAEKKLVQKNIAKSNKSRRRRSTGTRTRKRRRSSFFKKKSAFPPLMEEGFHEPLTELPEESIRSKSSGVNARCRSSFKTLDGCPATRTRNTDKKLVRLEGI
eukprot:TRINITY_DN8733_c0_g1_i1.p1 TRINITY_DN8733_c0_g1~~TRINITY_DN8733_c0_g1_i1.p1  ORF type:complete len:295 (+),score=84.53 TRINITY_DN8733_c0_g1_i1:72-956(+)